MARIEWFKVGDVFFCFVLLNKTLQKHVEHWIINIFFLCLNLLVGGIVPLSPPLLFFLLEFCFGLNSFSGVSGGVVLEDR